MSNVLNITVAWRNPRETGIVHLAMNAKGGLPAETAVLRARARGETTADASFEQLYIAYSGVVVAWFRFRAGPQEAGDLAQDVWTIFYRRWRGWQFVPQMEAPGARPVLSFLYRTAQFVLLGHQRGTRSHEDLQDHDIADPQHSPEKIFRQAELNRCLALARQLSTAEEVDVLMGKLSGVPAAEIARLIGATEAAVDHRFRNALARLRSAIEGGKGGFRDG